MAGPTKVTHYQVQRSRRTAPLESPGVRRGASTGMDGDPTTVDWPVPHRPAWQW
jgi:hypothetical protein